MSSNDPGSLPPEPPQGAAGQPDYGQQSGYVQPPGYGQQIPAAGPYPGMVPVAVCQNCGTALVPNATACVSCQAPVMIVKPAKDKLVAGLLAIFVGGLGIHKFYLGYNTAGGIMLGLTLSGICFSFIIIGILWAWIPGAIALIEGIIYLTKSDADFQNTYVLHKKEWF